MAERGIKKGYYKECILWLVPLVHRNRELVCDAGKNFSVGGKRHKSLIRKETCLEWWNNLYLFSHISVVK